MRARWREVVGGWLRPALWMVVAMGAFVVAFLARKEWDLQTPVVAATGIILLWYTVEARGLRLEQEQLRKQQDADNELRNHPWLRATDLKPDWKAGPETGLCGRWTVYLPITNMGTSPAFDVNTRIEWKLTSDIPESGESVFRKVVLAPGDSAHTPLCEVDLHAPNDRVSIGVEIIYRNHLGGGGRLHLTFLQEEPGKGWANGPISYEFWLSDGRRYPAPPVAPGTTRDQASAAQEAVAVPTSPRWPPDWLRSAIQVSALVLTLEAALFLAKGNLGLAPKVIAELATTKWSYNLDVARSLSMQAADTWVGFVLLLTGFVLQMVNSLWPMRWKDFAVSRLGVIVGLGVSAVALGVAYSVSCFVMQRTEAQVIQILSALQ